MSRTLTRAERIEALRIKALERHARRARRWVAITSEPRRVNAWTGRPAKGTQDRIDAAYRLTIQAHNGYARMARSAWDAREDIA